MEYLSYPDEIFNFFRLNINNPYNNRPKTKGWIEEVLKRDSDYHRKEILERGQADFDTNFNLLSPGEKVILYCNYYMQMHIVSGYHVFLKCHQILSQYSLDRNKIIFVDFGCGSLTSGISLSWYCLQYGRKLGFKYLGIDSSSCMLNKARQIGQYTELFQSDRCSFKFLPTISDREPIKLFIERNLSNTRNLIILNFSYIFASKTLNVECLYSLVNNINKLYGDDNEILIVFQNPDNQQLNYKWEIFKENISMNSYIEASDKLKYRNTTSSFNQYGFSKDLDIVLKYEILSNYDYSYGYQFQTACSRF